MDIVTDERCHTFGGSNDEEMDPPTSGGHQTLESALGMGGGYHCVTMYGPSFGNEKSLTKNGFFYLLQWISMDLQRLITQESIKHHFFSGCPSMSMKNASKKRRLPGGDQVLLSAEPFHCWCFYCSGCILPGGSVLSCSLYPMIEHDWPLSTFFNHH